MDKIYELTSSRPESRLSTVVTEEYSITVPSWKKILPQPV